MSMHPKPIGRANDLYPKWDATAVNNVGSDLAAGDLVLIDWTQDGDPVSIISPGTASALSATRMKAIVLTQQEGTNPSVLAAGATGRVRVQGTVLVNIATGVTFTAGDPIAISLAANSTDNGLITTLSVTASGTNPTYLLQSVGASLATTASSGTVQQMSVIFDGTQINTIYLKD